MRNNTVSQSSDWLRTHMLMHKNVYSHGEQAHNRKFPPAHSSAARMIKTWIGGCRHW